MRTCCVAFASWGSGVGCPGMQIRRTFWVAGGVGDCCKGIAAGLGAEGIAHGGAYGGVQSSVGAGHMRGCGELLSRFWGDGVQGAGEGSAERC